MMQDTTLFCEKLAEKVKTDGFRITNITYCPVLFHGDLFKKICVMHLIVHLYTIMTARPHHKGVA